MDRVRIDDLNPAYLRTPAARTMIDFRVRVGSRLGSGHPHARLFPFRLCEPGAPPEHCSGTAADSRLSAGQASLPASRGPLSPPWQALRFGAEQRLPPVPGPASREPSLEVITLLTPRRSGGVGRGSPCVRRQLAPGLLPIRRMNGLREAGTWVGGQGRAWGRREEAAYGTLRARQGGPFWRGQAHPCPGRAAEAAGWGSRTSCAEVDVKPGLGRASPGSARLRCCGLPNYESPGRGRVLFDAGEEPGG